MHSHSSLCSVSLHSAPNPIRQQSHFSPRPSPFVPMASAARAVVAAAPAAKRKLYTLVLLAEKGGEAGAATSTAAAAAVCSGAVAPLPPVSATSAASAVASPFASPYSRLLLGMKKRGFGAGKWNGFGGKIEPGETPRQAAIREIREEAFIESVRTGRHDPQGH